MSTIGRPEAHEYAPFFGGYVSLVPEQDPLPVLEAQAQEISRIAAGVTPEREQYRYADGKWSVREVFSHLVDAERVFGYRLFCISRGEQNSLPGFDENAYVATSGSDAIALAEHASELALVREANLKVLHRLSAEDWRRQGTANAKPVTSRALAFIMAGHVRHHLGVLRSRYGIPG